MHGVIVALQRFRSLLAGLVLVIVGILPAATVGSPASPISKVKAFPVSFTAQHRPHYTLSLFLCKPRDPKHCPQI